MFKGTGLTEGATGEVIAAASATKMGLDFVPLLFRGVLCNILVCLAIWCSFRIKSESGKLIMIFWCLFAFITTGFEHSIANMTLLTVSLLSPLEASVSLGGYFYNILVATLGNMLGAIICLAIPYVLIAREKEV
jgi:nitrite transporter NirC